MIWTDCKKETPPNEKAVKVKNKKEEGYGVYKFEIGWLTNIKEEPTHWAII